jgi:hypothetical protein
MGHAAFSVRRAASHVAIPKALPVTLNHFSAQAAGEGRLPGRVMGARAAAGIASDDAARSSPIHSGDDRLSCHCLGSRAR